MALGAALLAAPSIDAVSDDLRNIYNRVPGTKQ